MMEPANYRLMLRVALCLRGLFAEHLAERMGPER